MVRPPETFAYEGGVRPLLKLMLKCAVEVIPLGTLSRKPEGQRLAVAFFGLLFFGEAKKGTSRRLPRHIRD